MVVSAAAAQVELPPSEAGSRPRYNAAVTWNFGRDTSTHPTQRRFIGADPSGGPYGDW